MSQGDPAPVVRRGMAGQVVGGRTNSQSVDSPDFNRMDRSFLPPDFPGGSSGRREPALLDYEDRGSGLAAVSQSPDGKFMVVGGRDVLSVVSLESLTSKGGKFGDVFNVRRMQTKHKYHIQDVRWHPKSHDHIASAASNGTLVLWNIAAAKEGDSRAVAWESKNHQRTVWRLAWCEPVGNETLMLSGSLDGTIRMWDFRAPDSARSVMTMSKHQQQSAVRDLRVCGAEPWKLAAGLECGNEGAVVLWDVRKPDSPLLRIKEETGVHAVDWHPAYPSILATGRLGRPHAPGCVKVWDTTEDQPSPLAMIPTADGVSNIMWRPTYRTHLATTYMTHLSAIHVWDIMSYRTPLAVCAQHTQPTTDILWHDAHILQNPKNNSDDVCWILSVSKDGTVRRSHIEDAYLPFLHMRNSTFSQDAEGNFLSSHAHVNRSRAQLHDKAPSQHASASNKSALLHGFPALSLGKPFRHAHVQAPQDDLSGHLNRRGSMPADVPVEEDCSVVSGSTFRTLARVYEFEGGASAVELFRGNKAQCEGAGLRKRAAAWDFLACLFDESGGADERKISREGSTTSLASTSPEGGRRLSFGTGGGLVQEQGEVDAEASSIDGKADHKVFSVGLGPATTPELVSALVSGMLWHSVMEGDVQFSTTLALILGKQRLDGMGITSYEFVSWIESYLDLLGKFRAYPASAKIIKWCAHHGDINDETDPFRQIAVRSQKNTSIRARFGVVSSNGGSTPSSGPPPKPMSMQQGHASGSHRMLPDSAGRKSLEVVPQKNKQTHFRCGVCLEQTKGESEICTTCNMSFTKCGVCRLSVRGLYTWCQGCGHGGHVEHMQAWFKRTTACPTGCGHDCSFT